LTRRIRAGLLRQRIASHFICFLQLFGLIAWQQRRSRILLIGISGIRRRLLSLAVSRSNRGRPFPNRRHDHFRLRVGI
jgi:hypothetical protein